MAQLQQVQLSPALVSRNEGVANARAQYLLMTPAGQSQWVDDPETATAFPSMREATRMAMRLPATLKAFGLPRHSELGERTQH